MDISFTARQCRIKVKDFARMLSRYGFEECVVLQHFLVQVCGEHPDQYEIYYIWTSLRKCLERHDDGGAWFNDLRDMENMAHAALKLSEFRASD